METGKKVSQSLIISLCLTTVIPILVAVYLIKPDIFFVSGKVNAPLIIGITVVIIAMGIYIMFRISQAINRLSNNATLLAKGDLTAVNKAPIPPELKKHTDVSGLAESLNLITEQLIFNVDELESKAILLERTNRALEEINKTKDKFISTMSHELRAPLINIKQCSSMILEGHFGKVESKQNESLLMIRNNSQRLITLIADLLDVSKLNSRQLNYSQVNIQDLLNDALSTVSHWCESKGIKISLRGLTKEMYVYADYERIRQVCTNLLSNAIKYTRPHGAIVISVRMLKEKQMESQLHEFNQQPFVEIEVKDNGIGIAEADLLKIFDRFVQIKNPDFINSLNSTGLGLSIVKEIVEMHGGSIAVKSAVEKGSTFIVSLPLSENNKPEIQAVD
ncbi:MAG: HAMP domain-containing histidine kinase [Candidatus Omnitrophica bacterium]|nr:HAMP domain-containing histidine kinase [Candidatus Omnitrophota bacterium]